ncbi:hypothetical protein DENSPDRAFT_833329 [Dentipellis sp. KUC8613]|nr:hypothetical protein DENSPDRAFT_833329 [Dentipellis sp. KUC8613]
MFRSTRAVLPALRFYSTAEPAKPSLKLVAELRKLTEVSIVKAREALSATNNDVKAALEWLQKDLEVSGAKKAAKLDGRTAGEGLIGVSVLSAGTGSETGRGGVRAAMIELNCETDFVARNELFGKLVADIAHTAAFISDAQANTDDFLNPVPVDLLNDAPLLSQTPSSTPSTATVASAIRDHIAKLGEKISLKRATAVAHDPFPSTQPSLGLRVASYTHGGVSLPSQGRIGALALLALKSRNLSTLLTTDAFRQDLDKLQRSLARQIVGFETHSIHSPEGIKDETALYDQPFMMMAGSLPDESVRALLDRWAIEKQLVVGADADEAGGVQVVEFAKWTVGEDPKP